ncbi:MAG: hypothetical protein ACH34U_12425, partial [Cyanobium sp.]
FLEHLGESASRGGASCGGDDHGCCDSYSSELAISTRCWGESSHLLVGLGVPIKVGGPPLG